MGPMENTIFGLVENNLIYNCGLQVAFAKYHFWFSRTLLFYKCGFQIVGPMGPMQNSVFRLMENDLIYNCGPQVGFGKIEFLG